ncbi:hypothetical protein N7451_010473 [Penicillium sp. IBT 35674x]|nr:hypothetical protein N7451_010473 [Penicillium sp. IBT 35674x]
MSLLGKKFPGALGLIVLYGVNSLQNALSNTHLEYAAQLNLYRDGAAMDVVHRAGRFLFEPSAEFKNDPRNPNAGKPAH